MNTTPPSRTRTGHDVPIPETHRVARQAGLGDTEITRAVNSARRTSQHRADYQAEAGDRR
jgi:hypothetical protein